MPAQLSHAAVESFQGKLYKLYERFLVQRANTNCTEPNSTI